MLHLHNYLITLNNEDSDVDFCLICLTRGVRVKSVKFSKFRVPISLIDLCAKHLVETLKQKTKTIPVTEDFYSENLKKSS